MSGLFVYTVCYENDVKRLKINEFNFDSLPTRQYITPPNYEPERKLLCSTCNHDVFDELYDNHYECDACGAKVTIITGGAA